MDNLDRWIKNKLEEHASARPEDAWSRFEAYKEASDLDSEQRFDQFVKTKLEKHQAHFQNKLWAGLSFNLHKEAFCKKELWVAKTFEVLFMVLAFWQLFQFGFLSTDQPNFDPAPKNQEPIAQIIPERESNRYGANQFGSNQTTLNSEGSSADSKSSIQNGYPQANSSSILDLVDLPIAEPNYIPLKVLSHNSVDNSMNTFIVPYETSFIELHEEEEIPLLNTAPADQTLDKVLTLSPQLVYQSLSTKIEPQIQQNKQKYRHRIGLALLQDLHFITTPYDALLEEYGYDQVAYGGGGSVGYSWEGGKWGIRSQLTYRYLNYLPKPYTEVFDGDLKRGFFAESIRNIELNKLSLSLLATRSIGRIGHWHCYTITGATVHAAVLANYDRRAYYIPGQDIVDPASPPSPQNQSKTSEKRFVDGLFENGPILENTYLTLDIGVGLERSFNDRLSIFLEPNYQHNPFKKSLGPNSDRINTLSFLTGVRIQL